MGLRGAAETYMLLATPLPFESSNNNRTAADGAGVKDLVSFKLKQ